MHQVFLGHLFPQVSGAISRIGSNRTPASLETLREHFYLLELVALALRQILAGGLQRDGCPAAALAGARERRERRDAPSRRCLAVARTEAGNLQDGAHDH